MRSFSSTSGAKTNSERVRLIECKSKFFKYFHLKCVRTQTCCTIRTFRWEAQPQKSGWKSFVGRTRSVCSSVRFKRFLERCWKNLMGANLGTEKAAKWQQSATPHLKISSEITTNNSSSWGEGTNAAFNLMAATKSVMVPENIINDGLATVKGSPSQVYNDITNLFFDLSGKSWNLVEFALLE